MLRMDEIGRALARYRPRVIPPGEAVRAAVAVVLRDRPPRPPEILFIERARHEADPWSGHMAFPGGRMDPQDVSLQAAAERETLEEVGLALSEAEPLGRLDDLPGRHAGRPAGLVISAFVYHHPKPRHLRPNHEVETTLWTPLDVLHQPERRVEYVHPRAASLRYPGILVGQPDRHVVWGLTYRFLEVLFEAVGRPLPNRWEG